MKYLILLFIIIPIMIFGQNADLSDFDPNYPTAIDDSSTFSHPDSLDVLRDENLGAVYRAVIELEEKVGVGTDIPASAREVLIQNSTNDSTEWRALVDSDIPKSQWSSVAKSGGGYATIQSAISAASASASNPAIIEIYPGVYTENITLSDGIFLYGHGTEEVLINGTVTTAGLNKIFRIKTGDLIVGVGDTVQVEHCVLSSQSTYVVNQSGGTLFINGCIDSIEADEPAYNITGGSISIERSRIRNGKMYVSGDTTTVHIFNTEMSCQNTGNYFIRTYDSSKVIVNNSYLHPINSSGNYTDTEKGSAGGVKGITAFNNSIIEMNNTRNDCGISTDDSADVNLSNYVAKYTGRLGAAATSTIESKSRLINFHLHVDNGSQVGSHVIEVASGGDVDIVLENGVVEYMGDQGEFPMIGNACAGGGNQTWIDVKLIDWGSALNDGYTYGQDPIYGIGNNGHWGKLINCKIFCYADTVSSLGQYNGFRMQPLDNDTLRIRMEGTKFYFKPEMADYCWAIYSDEYTGVGSKRYLKNYDSLYIDIEVYNGGLWYASGTGIGNGVEWDSLAVRYRDYNDFTGDLLTDKMKVAGEAYFLDDVTIDSTLDIRQSSTIRGTINTVGAKDVGSSDSTNVIFSWKSGNYTFSASPDTIWFKFNFSNNHHDHSIYRMNTTIIPIYWKTWSTSNSRDGAVWLTELIVFADDVLGTDNYELTTTKQGDKSANTMTDATCEFDNFESDGSTDITIRFINNHAATVDFNAFIPWMLNVESIDVTEN